MMTDDWTNSYPCDDCPFSGRCLRMCTVWKAWFRAAWPEACAPFRQLAQERGHE